MTTSGLHAGRRRLQWHTTLVLVGTLVVAGALLASTTALLPLLVTTAVALAGATAFVLGVSASISAFLQRESYADSDFWR
ncbi:hypothetical protein [Microlunatus flavus]|uniref:Uncharacterized protein n=1 Tax=Microlunatus flavus TaxID=1036181 RepID=A0A1H9KGU8_9ACTN|nr:hypothetical protein [Microlunatus flavus]SEQ98147.1 hypothetical protein SAMN05421756_107205 [Microlunatus flavus]